MFHILVCPNIKYNTSDNVNEDAITSQEFELMSGSGGDRSYYSINKQILDLSQCHSLKTEIIKNINFYNLN